jgi:signal transduction histidine kinase
MGLVVTDLTEARRAGEMLRALARRIVQVQEEERGRVALELHDNITQLICGLLFRSQALANQLTLRDGKLKREAVELRDMLGETAEEVERISHNLGPHVLDHLGLAAALGEVGKEFETRTGVIVTITAVRLAARLPPDTELALYRILQEALRNVEKHASARNVTVHLSRDRAVVRFAISDDGIGFSTEQRAGRKPRGRLGLLGMSERAGYVGGTLRIKSGRGTGTRIEVLVPLAPAAQAGGRRRE